MNMPSVYIETTVVSYLTARPSRDLIVASHQQITHDWWTRVLPSCEPFVSPIVLEEISKGDAEQSRLRVEKLAGFSVLQVTDDVRTLAEIYFKEIDIPEKARADAYHLASAAWHGMDYLISWNCTHITSGRVRAIIEKVNAHQGIRSPIICTPEELMEV